ncbi:thioredoxin family protein [Candidatus Micrarchaeota archaeon]|nr:thioredoxin family protein [Candidatus Micrarchaeota archaeon]
MEPVYVEIVTAPNCPHSPKALKIALTIASKTHDVPIVVREISVATDEGRGLAEDYAIDATPTITINGKIAYIGVPSINAFNLLVKDFLRSERYRNNYFF